MGDGCWVCKDNTCARLHFKVVAGVFVCKLNGADSGDGDASCHDGADDLWGEASLDGMGLDERQRAVTEDGTIVVWLLLVRSTMGCAM